MIDFRTSSSLPVRIAVGSALLVLATQLGGCASVGDSFASGAFVDPAKYDMYDCKQLEAERKTLAARSAELHGLMDKARTGAGGAVVSELAYGNDLVSARASSKLAEENWQRSKCVESPAGTVASPAIVAPAAADRSARRR